MLESKLLELLSCFSMNELKQFKLMVDSPFFNNQVAIKRLMDYLMDFAPKFNHARLNYRNAYTYIYGKKTVQSDPQTAVQKVMSKLLLLVKEFAMQCEMAEQPIQRSLAIAKFFEKRHMLDQVPKYLDEAKEHLGKAVLHNEAYYRHSLLVEIDYASYLNMVQDRTSVDYNLSQQNLALDRYYAISKLQAYCYAKNSSFRAPYDFDFSQLSQFLQWIEASTLLKEASIQTWYLALKLLAEPVTENFTLLRQGIQTNKSALDAVTLRALYSFLANTAALAYTEREAYLRILFGIYKEQIELDIIYINGFLSPALLRNITIMGLKQKEFDWVEWFLHQNAERIVPTYLEREDILSLCWAYLYFEKGDFNAALDRINALRYDNVFTKMDERRLRLMCYYELRIDGPFDDLVNSFRKFLTDYKSKTPMSYIEANRLFINYIHRLSNLFLLKKDQLQALYEEIEKVQVLPEKEWLLRKLEEQLRLKK